MLNEEEKIKAVVYDNVNVTEQNPIKELTKIIFQLLIYVVIVYIVIFCFTGICIKNLSISQQIWLENAIANTARVKTIEISSTEKEHLVKIKNSILELDLDFPETSLLNIGIIKNKRMNAYCFPNGNIYITDSLYKNLTSDEMLTFVIAHEMAHYKNKDHLMTLRKNITNNFILLTFALSNSQITDVGKLVSSTLNLADVNYSKRKEALADRYAAIILKEMYGDVDGGIEVLQTLGKGDYQDGYDFLSTHPSIKRRISYLKKY